MPFAGMMVAAEVMGIADGPTEVHKVTVARQVLREYKAVDGLWPSAHLPTRRAAARERYAAVLEHEVGNL
jgi:acyl-CoA dehydrogenase